MSRFVLMDRFCNQSLGLRIYSLLYLIFIPASASGGKFGDWKALNPSELTLVDLLPRMRSEAKQTQTSGTAGLPFSSLAEAISFLREYSYYNSRAWQIGRRSDNYDILDQENNILAVFTHHGEMYLFSPCRADLTIIRRNLRKAGLWSVIEESESCMES